MSKIKLFFSKLFSKQWYKDIYEEYVYWELYYRISDLRGKWNDILNSTYRKWRLGFNPSDVWSFDHHLANHILPRLKYFKKKTDGHPSTMTQRQWHRELDKMIKAFELLASDDYFSYDRRGKKQAMLDEGLDSFRKHFQNLWC